MPNDEKSSLDKEAVEFCRVAQLSANVFYHGVSRLAVGNNLGPLTLSHAMIAALTRQVVAFAMECGQNGQEKQFAEDVLEAVKGAATDAIDTLGRGRSEGSDLHPGGSTRPN
ncbi:MAG: hypothetical protein ACR2RF_25340 [Geminicoccaceae bacterium]